MNTTETVKTTAKPTKKARFDKSAVQARNDLDIIRKVLDSYIVRGGLDKAILRAGRKNLCPDCMILMAVAFEAVDHFQSVAREGLLLLSSYEQFHGAGELASFLEFTGKLFGEDEDWLTIKRAVKLYSNPEHSADRLSSRHPNHDNLESGRRTFNMNTCPNAANHVAKKGARK